jgi:hypothetical protein
MAHSPIHLLLIDLAEGVCKSLEVAELEQRIGALEEKAKLKNMQDTEFTIYYSPFTTH